VSAESLTLDQVMSARPGTVYPKSEHIRLHLRDLLSKEAIFRHVDVRNLDRVVDNMKDRIVEKGDFVIRQGEYGDGAPRFLVPAIRRLFCSLVPGRNVPC
jgi:cAMP-dependent protein kinase regulator